MNACDLKNHTIITILQHTVKHSKVLGLNLQKMEYNDTTGLKVAEHSFAGGQR